MMIAILGTLPFIATLWLLVIVGAAVLQESGGKIASALKGEPALDGPAAPAVRNRSTIVRSAPRPASVEWRAAA